MYTVHKVRMTMIGMVKR